jgi:hypothetical protein
MAERVADRTEKQQTFQSPHSRSPTKRVLTARDGIVRRTIWQHALIGQLSSNADSLADPPSNGA